MKYMIADPNEQNSVDLKKIMDGYKMLNFGGSFTTFESAKNSIREEPPDIAFIRMGKAELNAYELICEIREQNLATKVIFLSSKVEYAVEAYECEADGFLLLPFDRGKIKQLLLKNIKKGE
jgi:two-component SAPR family response regulator